MECPQKVLGRSGSVPPRPLPAVRRLLPRDRAYPLQLYGVLPVVHVLCSRLFASRSIPLAKWVTVALLGNQAELECNT